MVIAMFFKGWRWILFRYVQVCDFYGLQHVPNTITANIPTHVSFYKVRQLLIFIIIYLSWSWATCWPVPVSRIQKSLQSSAIILSAIWEIVFHYLGNLLRSILFIHYIQFLLCPIICPELVLFLIPCNLCICFVIWPSISCCSSHIFHLCCYSSDVPCFNSPSFTTI